MFKEFLRYLAERIFTKSMASAISDASIATMTTSDRISTRAALKKLLTTVFGLRLHLVSDAEIFVTSNIVTPRVLLLWRGIALFFSLVTFGVFMAPKIEGVKFLLFFTNLSFLGLIVNFMVLTGLSVVYASRVFSRDAKQHAVSGYETVARKGIPPKSTFMRVIVWMLYVLPAVYAWIIVPIFWLLLRAEVTASGSPYKWVGNLSYHGFNLVVMVIEGVLNRIPVPFSHGWYVTLTGLLYMFLTWVGNSTLKYVYIFDMFNFWLD